jgi:hypothetical protein
MASSFFNVENNLIDRSDLNIYEKMCSVVLARYAGRSEFSNMLNIQVIAIRMGCSAEEAEKALNSLIKKHLVTLEDVDRIEPEMLTVEAVKVSSKVIKSDRVEEPQSTAPTAFDTLESFDEENFEKPSKETKRKTSRKKKLEVTEEELDAEIEAAASEPFIRLPKKNVEKTAAKPVEKHENESNTSSKRQEPVVSDEEVKQAEPPTHRPIVPKKVREGLQELIDQVFEIVEENINDREARIILSFANNDVELVREKYKIAKHSQVSDKIEMLINELQKKEDSVLKSDLPRASEQTNSGATTPNLPPKSLKNSQIDLENINRMVAFKQNSYSKQGNKPK